MSYLNKLPKDFFAKHAEKYRVSTPDYMKRINQQYKQNKSNKVMVFDPLSKQLIKIPLNGNKKKSSQFYDIKRKIDEIKKKINDKKQKKKAAPKKPAAKKRRVVRKVVKG